MITNLEKALQIVNSDGGYHEGDSIDFNIVIRMLVEMAEWKDNEISQLKIKNTKLKKANSDASWQYEADHAGDWRQIHEMGGM